MLGGLSSQSPSALVAQEVCKRLRKAAAEGDAKQARVARLEAQLLEALSSNGSENGTSVEVSPSFHAATSIAAARTHLHSHLNVATLPLELHYWRASQLALLASMCACRCK